MNSEKIEEIKKKVSQEGLYIKRVPKKTKEEFISWSREDFEGDYGMALKWLIDFKSGLLSNPNQILNEKIEMLADELSQLKSQEPKKKVIRSVSGKTIAEQEVKEDE